MKEMFEILMNQIAVTSNNQDKLAFGESEEEEQNERENLEKVLQKYQSEIRTHIKKSRELEKLVIELNQKVESTQEQLKGKNKHIEVSFCTESQEFGKRLWMSYEKKRRTWNTEHRPEKTVRCEQASVDSIFSVTAKSAEEIIIEESREKGDSSQSSPAAPDSEELQCDKLAELDGTDSIFEGVHQ